MTEEDGRGAQETWRWVHRYQWRSPLTSDDDLAIFRIYDGGAAVHDNHRMPHRYLGSDVGWLEDGKAVRMPATAEEIARWDAAAVAHWAELCRAEQPVFRAHRRRHRWARYTWLPFVRRRLDAGVHRALRACAERLDAAWAAYRPTFDEVRVRWDTPDAARQAELDAQRRAREERQRRVQEEYDTWLRGRKAFAAAAKAKLWDYTVDDGVATVFRAEPARRNAADGGIRPARPRLTALKLSLELAGQAVTTVHWTDTARQVVESKVGAGNFESWWERTDSTARNRQAHDEAVALVSRTVQRVADALRAAGEPGAQPFDEGTRQPRNGWKPEFDWSRRDVPTPTATPPMLRPDTWSGEWEFDWYAEMAQRMSEHFILTSTGTMLSVASGLTDYDRHVRRWSYTLPLDFAELVLSDEVEYREPNRYGNPQSFRMRDYASAAEYVPFVQATARVVVDGFERLLTRHVPDLPDEASDPRS